MEQRINLRYEEPLKKLIIAMLENGELKSIQDAKRRFNIGGNTTVQKWLKKYDKEHLRPMKATKSLDLELERAEIFEPDLYDKMVRTIDAQDALAESER
jgi:hypothetical protein